MRKPSATVTSISLLGLVIGTGIVATAPPASAAACTPTTSVVSGQDVFVFDTVGTCTWTVPDDAGFVRLLVVAGGGAAGREDTGKGGGGGGGGGVIRKATEAVIPGAQLTIVVGAGATTLGGDGADSVFHSFTAVGGGGGGEGFGSGLALNGVDGGSGGGAAAAASSSGGAGTADQGSDGGDGGIGGCSVYGAGGGGAGGPGDDSSRSATSGGSGISDDITGVAVTYSPGGRGGKTCGFAGNSQATALGSGGNARSSGFAGVDGVVIVRVVGSPDDDPLPTEPARGEVRIIQQFGRANGEPCNAQAPDDLNWFGVAGGGWGESWAHWPNNGLGGDVCTRTLVYNNAQGRWTLAQY